MAVTSPVEIDLRGFHKFEAGLETNRHVVNALVQWNKTYNDFIIRRFKRFSKGGGSWPSLKTATIKRKNGNARILYDTGGLLSGLDIQFRSKNLSPMKVVAGFDRTRYHTSAGMLVADLAEIHQSGLGYNPQREIIVFPPKSVIKLLEQQMQTALERWADDTRN